LYTKEAVLRINKRQEDLKSHKIDKGLKLSLAEENSADEANQSRSKRTKYQIYQHRETAVYSSTVIE
jgi:hypothetical protein